MATCTLDFGAGGDLPRKKKAKAPASWTAYSLLQRRPFEDARWLLRWIRLKEELRLKLAR